MYLGHKKVFRVGEAALFYQKILLPDFRAEPGE
jgi:hypothetical protein